MLFISDLFDSLLGVSKFSNLYLPLYRILLLLRGRENLAMNVNKKLQKYIEQYVFPSYLKNDLGHNLDHIKYVIDRSLKFASTVENINFDMVYTIASYHDIGHYLDAETHEKISAQILMEDNALKDFFTEEQIQIMSEAIYDHRASRKTEPRSIYGKIVSSADRNTSIEVLLKRTYDYRKKHTPNLTLDEMIEDSRKHIIEKFGTKGYAIHKMYFEDLEYKKFLKDVSFLTKDKEKFRKKFMEVNGLNDNRNWLTEENVFQQ